MSFNGVKDSVGDQFKSYETETTATYNEHSNDEPRSKRTRKREIRVVDELGRDIGPTRSPLNGEVAQASKEPLEMVHIGDVRQPRLPPVVVQEPAESNLDPEAQGIVEASR